MRKHIIKNNIKKTHTSISFSSGEQESAILYYAGNGDNELLNEIKPFFKYLNKFIKKCPNRLSSLEMFQPTKVMVQFVVWLHKKHFDDLLRLPFYLLNNKEREYFVGWIKGDSDDNGELNYVTYTDYKISTHNHYKIYLTRRAANNLLDTKEVRIKLYQEKALELDK